MNPLTRTLMGTSLLVMALSGFAYAFPGSFWGINFHTYLHPAVPVVILGLAFGWTWWMDRRSATPPSNTTSPSRRLPKIPFWVISLLATLFMGALFIFLPIRTQLYGDTLSILKTMGKGGVFADKYHLAGAFSPDIFSTQNGEQFTYSLAAGIARALGAGIGTGFRILTAALGMVYAFMWMQFIQRIIQARSIRVLAAALGLTAGATQVFYGHPEVYAAPILVFTAYFIALVNGLETGNRRWLLTAIPLLLLAIRTHSAGFALVPTAVYAGIVAVAGNKRSDNAVRERLWREAPGNPWIGRIILGLSLVAGIMGYVMLFGQGDDSIRANDKVGNMFLTLAGDRSADNQYFMASSWHLWDFFQEILLCSAPAFAVILAFIFTRGRKKFWQGSAITAVAMAACLLIALYFAIDPQLTMPRDWDLFCLIAPPLLVLAGLLLARGEAHIQQAWIPRASILALAGLQFTFVLVNHDATLVHLRQLDLSRHIFQSGDGGGAFVVRHTLDAMPLTDRERVQQLAQILQELAPYESPHNRADFGYLHQYGGALSFDLKDYPGTLRFYQATYHYQPQQVESMEDLAVAEYHMNHFDQSLHYATLAMAAQSQRSSTWVLGFVSAMNLDRGDLALRIGMDYLRRFPGDPDQLAPQIQALQEKMGH